MLGRDAATLADGGLLFANFVDFDTLYGHRRDVAGYAARARSVRRARCRNCCDVMRDGDLADHHRRPRLRSDLARHGPHARAVPMLAFGAGIARGSIGKRDGFADIGAIRGAPPASAEHRRGAVLERSSLIAYIGS